MLLVLIKTSYAQQSTECRFSESEAVVDSIEASRYYPLDVGNFWIYQNFLPRPMMPDYIIRKVEVDTVVNNNVFFKISETPYYGTPDSGQYGDKACCHRIRISKEGILHEGAPGHSGETNSFILSQPYNSCYRDATYGVMNVYELILLDSLRAKTFEFSFSDRSFIKDVGPYSYEGLDLVYAQVSGNLIRLTNGNIPTKKHVDSNLDEPIGIWPNPAQKYVRIRLSHIGPGHLIVYNSNGQEIDQKNIYVVINDITIDISNYASGIYIVGFTSIYSGVYSGAFIKTN